MIPRDPVIFWILVVWLTIFGACIGSFLNVVVYRLPLGKSLSDPPSHCPKCKHPIRWFDNVPVFGWLFLTGLSLNARCRDCKEPISPRYPIVEAICGGVFGSIAYCLLRREADASFQEFLCLTVALSTLVVTLLAAGLIEWDGQKVPWKLFIPAALMGPMVPWLWQDAFHVDLFSDHRVIMRVWKDAVYLYVIFESICHCVVISLFFCVITKMKQGEFALACSSFLIGLYFGILGTAIVLIASILLFIIWFWWYSRPTHLVLALLTFVFIFIILAQSPASAPLG